ncbi:MAG: A/G-specific adenine glycosylase [Bacteroidales bacterium]|nr:A/G-specific adenine glycosylase [Bacteroidales bacterium]
MAGITDILINWYSNNKRDLPWRNTRDPYAIWLSEVILQQTRVSQGLSYYYRFLETFPNVEALALASEEAVLKVWQGLGYYSRARNLHHTARVVANERNGVFPIDYKGLLELKGVGEYTAAAIASIAYNEAVPVVDGNVARVISRLFGIHEPINSTMGMKILKKISNELIPSHQPDTYNQAMMEFGALFCKPSNPDCPECPLKQYCLAFQKGEVGLLPVKNAKRSARDHYIYYLVMECMAEGKEQILIRRRTAQGIWKNLYDFPSVESAGPMEIASVLEKGEQERLLTINDYCVHSVSGIFAHQLTHRNIKAVFIHITLSGPIVQIGTNQWIEKDRIGELPVPRLIENYLLSSSFLNSITYKLTRDQMI